MDKFFGPRFAWVAAAALICTVAARAEEKSPISTRADARRYSQQLCEAFLSGSYARFAAVAPPELLAALPKSSYEGALIHLSRRGRFSPALTYLGELRGEGLMVLVWRISYRNEKGEEFDTLATTAFRPLPNGWRPAGFHIL